MVDIQDQDYSPGWVPNELIMHSIDINVNKNQAALS